VTKGKGADRAEPADVEKPSMRVTRAPLNGPLVRGTRDDGPGRDAGSNREATGGRDNSAEDDRVEGAGTRADASGTKTRSCRPDVLVDEPTEGISPLDVGHTAGRFNGSETLGYLKGQSPMRASPVVMLPIDPKDAIEMPGGPDQQPVQALCAKGLYPALGEGVRVRRPDRRADHPNPF
jgi:hypothetical protein